MYAYSVKGIVSILREQEIGNPWYNTEICVEITQFENQQWKRRTAGFSQLRPVKSYQLKLLITGNAARAIQGHWGSPTIASDGCGESQEDEYTNLEPEAYQMLFDYIRSDVLANEKIVRLTELAELLASYLTSLGVEEIKLSTKKHIRRNLQAEFGDVLLFENLLETASVFIVPAKLSPLQVASFFFLSLVLVPNGSF